MSLSRFATTLALLLVAHSLFAAEEPVKKPAKEDKSVASPLTAKIVVKEDTYTIPADQQGEKFRDSLKDPKLGSIPEPPAVALVFEITNPTDKPITIVTGSDAGALTLDLQGPGAVNVSPLRPMTREFRLGKQVEIAPGKTYEIPITKLQFGMRGISSQAHWTEPGEYTLGATLRWPDPTGMDGALPKVWKVTAEPVKLMVKAAK